MRISPSRFLITAVAVVSLAAGCGTDDDVASPVDTSTSTSTTVAATTTTSQPLVAQKTPSAAASSLLGAWRKGDRAAALQVAPPAVVDQLFAQPAMAFSDRGCQEPLGGQADCDFRYGTGLISVATVTQGDGWVVKSVAVHPG